MHTRYPRGQSGNPRGRPKGVRNFKTDVEEILRTSIKITRDGKPRRISTQAAALLRLREKALGGDSRALDRLLQLAQIYNNEEVGPTAALPEDDAAVLETFVRRLTNGAGKLPVKTKSRTKPLASDRSKPTGGSQPRYKPKKP